MKKLLYFLAFLIAIAQTEIQAQPIITNAQDFAVGTVLKFRPCETMGVYPGAAGANQTWDFSGLTALPDTNFITMADPVNVANGNLFPAANLVEQFSDGRNVFVIKSATENHLTGFEDTNTGLTINYTNPMLFAKRPITFADVFTDTYAVNYSVAGLNFSGQGAVEISADAYGTLILPNATYQNVLRIKIASQQTDTLLQFNTVSHTHNTTYVWHDGVHASALLKIDSTSGSNFSNESVAYLLSETLTATAKPDVKNMLGVYPNPASDMVIINVPENGELLIFNQLGQLVQENKVAAGSTKIDLNKLFPGAYFVRFQGNKKTYSVQLIINPQ